MLTTAFTINDYLAYIKTSHRKRLLVEGRDDYKLFSRVFDIFKDSSQNVDIDIASQIRNPEEIQGNREKIEVICNKVKGKDYASMIVGFVDREFRGFVWDDGSVNDELMTHRVDDRIIWSRGHSIENYFFDFSILHKPISSLSTSNYYREGLVLFEENFKAAIKLACAASLVGYQINNFNLIRSQMNWYLMNLDEADLLLDLKMFEEKLEENNFHQETIELILEGFQYWIPIIKKVNFDIIRWMCHGHIGFTIIWELFKKCVYQASENDNNENPTSEINRAISAKEEIRFNLCALEWIDLAFSNKYEFPFEIIDMLDMRKI